MNGQHIQGTPMVVDYWKTKNLPPRLLFFLTHMHADHTSGLSASWQYPIHCTPLTAKLLKRKFSIATQLVVELELDTPTLIHVTSPHSNARVSITVTAIDANHCPGSSMFLFEGYFGRILYTGDFRYSPLMAENPHLVGNRGLDALYLDNTYCDVTCNFPTREEATEMLLSLLRSHPDQTAYLGLHTLGKEELLVKVAMAMGRRVGVDQERLELLKLLEMPDVFDVDTEECWIKTCPFYALAKNYVREVRSEEALGILPTALYTGQGAISCPAHVKVVPYSDHSSFSELRSFVALLRPRSVHPVVQGFTGEKAVVRATRTNMAVFSDLLDAQPPSEYSIPVAMVELLTGTRMETFSSKCFRRGSLAHRGRSPSPPCHSNGKPANKKALLYSITRRARGVHYLSPSKPKRQKMSGKDDRESDSGQVSSAESSDCNEDTAVCQRSIVAALGPRVDVTPIACNGRPISTDATVTSFFPGKTPLCTPPLPEAMCSSHKVSLTPLPTSVKTPPVSTPPTIKKTTPMSIPLPSSSSPTGDSPKAAWSRQEPAVCARVIPIGQLNLRNHGWGGEKVVASVGESGPSTTSVGFGEELLSVTSLTCVKGDTSTLPVPEGRCYPDKSQIVNGLGCRERQLHQHAKECGCVLCKVDLAGLCIQSHDVRHCFCDRCAWGIRHYFEPPR